MSENKEQFKEFYEKHPNLDNGEYYAEFPEVNKSTIRSWKYALNKQNEPIPPTPNQEPKEEDKYKVMYAQTLGEQIEYNMELLKGVPVDQQLIVLQNAKVIFDEDQKTKKRSGNSSILPQPLPKSQTMKRYGIDEYINFDKIKNEIKMQIPIDELLDPEKNKKLGLLN